MAASGTPSGLYTGGAASFNAEPYVSFQTNLLATKAAKDEALNKYYTDMVGTIKPTGVRSQDIPGFIDKVNALQNLYLQKQDNIKNPLKDKGAAQSEFNARYNDILGYIESSKGRTANQTLVAPILSDPDKRARVTAKTMADIHANDLPLNDPNSKELDPSSLNYDPKPFDLQSHLKLYTDLKPNKQATTLSPAPSDKLSNIETTTATFSPEDIKTIGSRALASYQSDPIYKSYIDNLAIDPAKFQQYNNIYKQAMGQDLDMKHPEELAFAHDLGLLQQNNTTQKIVPNEQAKLNAEEAKDKRVKQAQGSADVNTVIPQYVNGLVANAKDVPLSPYKDIPVDATLAKALDRKGSILGGMQYNPSNNTFIPVYYQSNKDGNIKYSQDGDGNYLDMNGDKTDDDHKIPLRDKQIETPYTVDQLSLALGAKTVSKKTLPTEVGKSVSENQIPTTKIPAPSTTYSVGNKKYTHADLNKLGYTDEDIVKAQRLGTIK